MGDNPRSRWNWKDVFLRRGIAGNICSLFWLGCLFVLDAEGPYLCRSCRRQVSLQQATVFQGSRLHLPFWSRAMWVSNESEQWSRYLGSEAHLGPRQLSEGLALVAQTEAGYGEPGGDCIKGTIEVDETYGGGEEAGKYGRGAFGKALVVITVENEGCTIGPLS